MQTSQIPSIQWTEKGVPYVTLFHARYVSYDGLSDEDVFTVAFPSTLPIEGDEGEEQREIRTREDLERWAEDSGYEAWEIRELPLCDVSEDGQPQGLRP